MEAKAEADQEVMNLISSSKSKPKKDKKEKPTKQRRSQNEKRRTHPVPKLVKNEISTKSCPDLIRSDMSISSSSLSPVHMSFISSGHKSEQELRMVLDRYTDTKTTTTLVKSSSNQASPLVTVTTPCHDEIAHSSTSAATISRTTSDSDKVAYQNYRNGWLCKNTKPFENVTFCFSCECTAATSALIVCIEKTGTKIVQGALVPIYRELYLCPACHTQVEQLRSENKTPNIRVSSMALDAFFST